MIAISSSKTVKKKNGELASGNVSLFYARAQKWQQFNGTRSLPRLHVHVRRVTWCRTTGISEGIDCTPDIQDRFDAVP